jgi:carbamoyl-phosphate synthase small subunit
MVAHDVPGISGIDTRALTKRLREKGTMLGKIIVGGQETGWDDPNRRNVVAKVSVPAPVEHPADGPARCVLVDFGVKHNIIRSLTRRGISVLQVPWDYDWTREEVDGVVLSNGPGDPKTCAEAVEVLRKGFSLGVPILGICLGHQLLALAAGGDTFKMRYGHRSQNQPCVQVGSKRCFITSQNHGFAVNEQTLGEEWQPWFFNANDGTNEGIRHRSKPFYSVQFHPEAHPGPSDTDGFFDMFARLVSHAKSAA